MSKKSFIVAVLASVLTTAFVLLFAFCDGGMAFAIKSVDCYGENMEIYESELKKGMDDDSYKKFRAVQDNQLFFDWHTDGKKFVLSVRNQSENDIKIESVFIETSEKHILSYNNLIAIGKDGKEINRIMRISCNTETNMNLIPESIFKGTDKNKNIFPRFPFWVGGDYRINMHVRANQFYYHYTFDFDFPVCEIFKDKKPNEYLPFEEYEYIEKCVNYNYHPYGEIKIVF